MDSYKKSKRKSIIAWTVAFILAIGAAIVSFMPFVFMVLNSFKEKFEMLTKGVFQLPDKLNWSNYTEVLTGGFGNYFKNSVIVLVISLILLLFISACASYSADGCRCFSELFCGSYERTVGRIAANAE